MREGPCSREQRAIASKNNDKIWLMLMQIASLDGVRGISILLV